MLFADRLIGTFVLGLSQIIATEMLLGVLFKQLYSSPLFLLNAFVSTGVLIFALYTHGGKGICSEINAEFVRILKVIKKDIVLLCIFCLFLISVGWLVFLGYLFPSYSWDALYYHLPIVGQIMQSGAIQENANPSFIQQYMNIFSKNVNLFFLWNIIFLESDVIVDLSQLFFTIAGVLSIYSMAIKMRVKEKYAIYSALLFFFTPALIFQSTINYVDGAVSMLLIIVLNFLMYDDIEHYACENNAVKPLSEKRLPIILSGLAAGILLGSKPTAPLFIAVLLGTILIQEIIKYFRPFDSMSSNKGYLLKDGLSTYLTYFIAPALLIGGYWYMRNWIFYGNPVYYMDVSIFNTTLFKGMKSDWVEPAPQIIEGLNYFTALFHVWQERVGYYIYDSRLSGFGPIWFVLFLPAIIISMVQAIIRKKYSFLFITAILLLTFIVHPRNWTTRYVIFIVGLGAVSFGIVSDYFYKRDYILKAFALIFAFYTFLTANSPCITPGQIKDFLAMPSHERTLSRLKPFNIDIKVRKEYGHWIWIDNNILRGNTLAYSFESFELDTSRPFFTAPLWNREFSNRVVYVKSETYKGWLKELKRNHSTYILVRKNSIEDNWIEKERKVYYSLYLMGSITEKFQVKYEDDHYKIVKYKTDKG